MTSRLIGLCGALMAAALVSGAQADDAAGVLALRGGNSNSGLYATYSDAPKPGDVCHQVFVETTTVTLAACFSKFEGYSCPAEGPCSKIGGQPIACPMPTPATTLVCAPPEMFKEQKDATK